MDVLLGREVEAQLIGGKRAVAKAGADASEARLQLLDPLARDRVEDGEEVGNVSLGDAHGEFGVVEHILKWQLPRRGGD
eukprot:CAMPEP_0174723426 /NCGR_PEP_ID=MMETSP1094-20130205/40915_1 /TAXON_ID=156173 /ORGANISM="Chrysochromulina brevifilum, Strain UTEX LB 985" /LENGTH=78 /DNA_ID=CAMNT_0015924461 /DNA_START=121 /DNA_END=357 /DNA_ORIENTATION=+